MACDAFWEGLSAFYEHKVPIRRLLQVRYAPFTREVLCDLTNNIHLWLQLLGNCRRWPLSNKEQKEHLHACNTRILRSSTWHRIGVLQAQLLFPMNELIPASAATYNLLGTTSKAWSTYIAVVHFSRKVPRSAQPSNHWTRFAALILSPSFEPFQLPDFSSGWTCATS